MDINSNICVDRCTQPSVADPDQVLQGAGHHTFLKLKRKKNIFARIEHFDTNRVHILTPAMEGSIVPFARWICH